MEGIFLRVEAGTKPPITERALGEFALVSAEYAQRQARLAELTKQQVRPGNAIKLMAQTCVGLRGIESEPDGYRLTVFPEYLITWDANLLKDSPGITCPTVAKETLGIGLSHTSNTSPLNGGHLQAALVERLVGLGLPHEQLGILGGLQVMATVNETTLASLIADGRSGLLDGIGDLTESWTITVNPLDSM
jgi:hypothetical protein